MTDMRVLTLDLQSVEEALGFVVADDRQSAHVAGAVDITVVRSADLTEYEFQFRIMLSNGRAIECSARRRALLTAAARVTDE